MLTTCDRAVLAVSCIASDGGMPVWAMSAGTVFDCLSRGIRWVMLVPGRDCDSSVGENFSVQIPSKTASLRYDCNNYRL